MQTQPEQPMMTVPQAAKYLGVSPVTLYRATQAGLLSHYRVGRVVRLALADLDNWARRAAIQAAP